MKKKLDWAALKAEVFCKRNYYTILVVGLFPPLFGTLQYLGGLSNDFHISEWTAYDGLLNVAYSFLVTATMVFSVTGIIAILNQLMPWKGNVTKRVFTEVLLVLIAAASAQSLILVLLEGTDMLYRGRPLTGPDYLQNIIFTTTITIIAAAILEGNYFFQNWRESLVATERLQKQHAESQLANLRNQLDPHFMFNSLNVLSSLIAKDPPQAERFVEKFAQVYRYLLEVRNETVVPLREEWAFVQNYLDLQQLRFKEGLQVSSNLDPTYLNHYLPPLSLQEVVSNAIKHNSIDKEQPLSLSISINENFLEVRNTLNLRPKALTSTGIGLENLKERYALLSTQKPEFNLNGKAYLARLPLLKADAWNTWL